MKKDKSIERTMEMLKEKQKHMNDPLNIMLDKLKIKMIRQGKLN